jgi:hypothetical protein
VKPLAFEEGRRDPVRFALTIGTAAIAGWLVFSGVFFLAFTLARAFFGGSA